MEARFSVVLICKNEVSVIGDTVERVRALTDDVVVYDCGSTDGTVALLHSLGAHVHVGPWLGYSATRRAAVAMARHDWVFCLDSDERADEQLQEALRRWQPKPGTAWRLRRHNYLADRFIRFGAWSNDVRIRLFHRAECAWNEALVHERVLPLRPLRLEVLDGCVLHRTAGSVDEYRRKLSYYAELSAEKYFREGKQASLLRRTLSPLFTFFKNYVLKGGFLEGSAGWEISMATARYTREKYEALWQRQRGRDAKKK